MRTRHLLTAPAVLTLTLALGLSACSDDAKDEATTPSTSTSTSTQEESTTGSTDEASGSGDFCTVALSAFSSFDASALAGGDASALHEIADSFRAVSEVAEGDAQAAWSSYADFLGMSADAVEDPTKAGDMAAAAQDAGTWMTEISDSLVACS